MKKLLFLLFLFGCVTPTLPSFPPNGVLKKGVTVIEYSTTWCPACIEMHPILAKLEKQMGFKRIMIDADDKWRPEYINYHQSITTKWVPVVSIFVNGRLFYHGGWPGEEEFVWLLNDVMEKK